jgi:hypothetical protein
MSFGGHVAMAAAAAVEADEELENSLAGINISDDDNHSDMSMDRIAEMHEEVISIASSAASMERKALETRIVQLEMKLRETQKKKVNPNQILHEQILVNTNNTRV